MIQPATPSLSALLGLPSGTAPQAILDLPDGADFRSLFALETPDSSPGTGETCSPLPGAGKPANPAPLTADPGKILPPRLPGDMFVPPAAKLADLVPVMPVIVGSDPVKRPEPVPVTPVIAGPLAIKPTELVPVMPVIAVSGPVNPVEPVPVMPVITVVGAPLKDRPAPLPETKDGPVPVSDVLPAEPKPAVPAPLLVTLPVPAALPGIPQPVAGPPVTPAPRRALGPQRRTVPTLPVEASLRAQGRNAVHRAEAVATAPAAPVGLQSPAPAPANARDAPPAEEVRIAMALPRLALGLVLAREAFRLAAAPREIATADALTIDPALAQPVASQPQSVPLEAAAPAPLRPHDFAALIDRITAARDAVSAQAVSITLAHQDFGPVRLQFRSEEAGLAVSMTSPDPDFARAAAASPAPVVHVTQTEQSSMNPSRGESQTAQSYSQGQSQAGSSGQQRRDSQPQPTANPLPRSPASRATPHRGIFA